MKPALLFFAPCASISARLVAGLEEWSRLVKGSRAKLGLSR